MGLPGVSKITKGGMKMKKKLLTGLAVGVLMLGMVSTTQATTNYLSPKRRTP